MKTLATFFKLVASLILAVAALTGCESTDGGGSGGGASANIYYGVGFYDPWYYGPGYYPPDVIVPPPPARPGGGVGAHPSHPIASPPSVSKPAPRPMPSIPAAPRPSFRR